MEVLGIRSFTKNFVTVTLLDHLGPDDYNFIQEYAFRVLAERFGEMGEGPEYRDRIQDWVEGTTPGMIDDDMNVSITASVSNRTNDKRQTDISLWNAAKKL